MDLIGGLHSWVPAAIAAQPPGHGQWGSSSGSSSARNWARRGAGAGAASRPTITGEAVASALAAEAAAAARGAARIAANKSHHALVDAAGKPNAGAATHELPPRMQVSARGSEQRPPKTKTAEAAELIHKARKVLLGTSAAAAAAASTAAAETSAEAAAAAAAAAAAETAEVAEAETSSEPVAAVQKRSSKHEVFPRTNPRPPRSAQPHSRWEERQMLASALAESLALAEAVAATRGIIEASEAAEAAAQGSSSAPILGKRPLPPTGVAAAASKKRRLKKVDSQRARVPSAASSSVGRSNHVGGDGADDDDDDDDGDYDGPRCLIYGCRKQLLVCHGLKDHGAAIGCAEEGHVLCKPCLTRWFCANQELRAESGLNWSTRRCCPVCRCELRGSGVEVRDQCEHFWMGLSKVGSTWD